MKLPRPTSWEMDWETKRVETSAGSPSQETDQSIALKPGP